MATITSPRAVSPNPSRITSPPLQSASGTPTSSVRNSLDNQSVTGSTSNLATPTVVAPPNPRRNRAALRDYYNIKSKPTATSPGRRSTDSDSTVASSTQTPTNARQDEDESVLPPQLDDPTFDADKYVQDLLKTSTLRDVLRAEGTLVSEIRNYDGERKALVYDNYSKLIKAVSTIGEMQKGMREQGSMGKGQGIDGIKALEGKLDKLMSVVKEIQGDESAEHKTMVEERRKLRQQKKKQDLVKWVLNAPKRLGDLVEDGKRDEAMKEWERVRELLVKWENVKGVDEVRTACEKVLASEEEEESQIDDR